MSNDCFFFFQLAPERGRLPAASENNSPWGEALKQHAVAEVSLCRATTQEQMYLIELYLKERQPYQRIL